MAIFSCSHRYSWCSEPVEPPLSWQQLKLGNFSRRICAILVSVSRILDLNHLIPTPPPPSNFKKQHPHRNEPQEKTLLCYWTFPPPELGSLSFSSQEQTLREMKAMKLRKDIGVLYFLVLELCTHFTGHSYCWFSCFPGFSVFQLSRSEGQDIHPACHFL